MNYSCIVSLYFNLPKTQINRLQHIQNSHITAVLEFLHWLKIEQCIQFKLISVTYKVLTTSQPTYLHNLISLQTDNNTHFSYVVTFARPSPTTSLKITDRSFHRLISGINFLLHFVNQFHLFMLISIHPSLLHFPRPPPLQSFTLNSKLTFLVNPFRYRSLTIDTADRLLG